METSKKIFTKEPGDNKVNIIEQEENRENLFQNIGQIVDNDDDKPTIQVNTIYFM
jgi:hypothetical protein